MLASYQFISTTSETAASIGSYLSFCSHEFNISTTSIRRCLRFITAASGSTS